MTKQWQAHALIDLLRNRYPNWDGFMHAPFVADEIAYKRKASQQAAALLGREPFAELLDSAQYTQILTNIQKLGRSTNLLYNRTPKQGDLSILNAAELPQAAYCHQLFQLLHGDGATRDRLDSYAHFVADHHLPNKWTLPTLLLFLLNPAQEMFVKPRAMQWFLRFMGEPDAYARRPNGNTYASAVAQAQHVLSAIPQFSPSDLIDIQSLIWVAYRESLSRTGRLSPQAQIALDRPPTIYSSGERTYAAQAPQPMVHESSAEYELQPEYSLAQCAAATGLPEDDLARWVRAVERKGQAVFYGPPGTGKTFVSQQLANHLIGGGDGFSELVQFHPAYAYEDFVQGIRPIETNGTITYSLVPGRFLDFCQRAAQRNDTCVLIIDEINRADLARVFGELMYLLEYREQSVPLAAGGEPFKIPANVRILGTMNTADRSLALVDHALRRRFAFVPLHPNYAVLRHHHTDSTFPIDPLIAILQQLNAAIEPDYRIGVTYFLPPVTQSDLADVWQMEIEPQLEEYFFDQPNKVKAFRWAQISDQLLV